MMKKTATPYDNKKFGLPPSPRSIGKWQDFDISPLERQRYDRYGQDTRHRKVLVWWMIIVISIWLTSVLLLVGFNQPWCLDMPEAVQVTLLATTTANVLGLPSIILRDLFGRSNRKDRFNK